MFSILLTGAIMAHHTNSITIKILRDWSVLNFLVAISIICIPLAFDPYFYFNDDVQTQYIPVYREIGAAYARLELPLLSGEIFHGDNFLLEYQYGLFNPVSIIISVLIYIVHRGDLGVDILRALIFLSCFMALFFLAERSGFVLNMRRSRRPRHAAFPGSFTSTLAPGYPALQPSPIFPGFSAFSCSSYSAPKAGKPSQALQPACSCC
jgi:hypothetical protein